ncbi:MAG: T9SS type A sorting domain-containing protein [Flavobacteriales bacterium]|nr:T9SS type A sorting domain-containing protein [Flavobacteriales bacterium]
MKWVFIFFLLIVSGTVSAQTYAPFPLDETSEWRIERYWLSVSCVIDQSLKYYVAEDTVLDGKEYRAIRLVGKEYQSPGPSLDPQCSVPPYTIAGLKRFMRMENGVYYSSLNGLTESVLFDFSLGPGDFFEGFEIDSVDLVDVNGTSCRRQWLNPNGIEPDPIWIIEGVGHAKGLFEPMFDGLGFSSTLMCYSENNIPLIFGENENCDMTISVAELSKEMFTVSPNPSSGVFRIRSLPKARYRIFNLFGRSVQAGQLSGSTEIDITNEPSGIYLLQIRTDAGQQTVKIVKQ